MLVSQLCLTLCDSMDSNQSGSSVHGSLCPGKNTRVDCHSFLQGIFPTQESNPGLLHCRQILYCLGHREAQTVKGKQLTILCCAFSCESPVHGICVSTPYYPSPSLCHLIHCPSSRHVLASSKIFPSTSSSMSSFFVCLFVFLVLNLEIIILSEESQRKANIR